MYLFLQIQYMIRYFFDIKYGIQITLFQKKNNDIKISVFLWKNKIAKIWIVFR